MRPDELKETRGMSDDVLLYKKDKGVGLITLNRPKVRNALNREVFRRLEETLLDVGKDEEVEVLIVTGAQGAFAAGADVNELSELEPISGWKDSRSRTSVFDRLERLGKPSVAAINGFALGGGLELAMACTVRVASERAKLGLPELGLGILPGWGGMQRLTRLVGHGKAAEMVLTAAVIDAHEAYRIGLVNQVVSHAEVVSAAEKMAESIMRHGRTAVGLTMEFLLRAEEAPVEAGLALESALAALCLASKEAKELVKRFLEKKGR
jgi:enoyl-CoA hydratase